MLMGHKNKTQETDSSWKAVWPKLVRQREFEVKRAVYYSFSGLPPVAEVLGLQKRLSLEVERVLATVKGGMMMNLTVSYVTAFLESVLLGKLDEFLDLSEDLC